MTIKMNTDKVPTTSLNNDSTDLTKEELDEYVELGLLSKVDNHREHFALHPCWMNDTATGVLEELSKNFLGRWCKSLNSYLVAVKNIKNAGNSAGLNEDHKWLHVDVVATYYTFSPKEGQILKGPIKKVGIRAASCMVFDVFAVTVFTRNRDDLTTELTSWKVGDTLTFKIISFIHRKCPILRAESLPQYQQQSLTEIASVQDVDFDAEPHSRKEKKKKRKSKSKDERPDEIVVEYDKFADSQDVLMESAEDVSPKKKKKKKKSME